MAFTEKYVTNAGAGAADGSSLANAWSWATMLTTLSAGQRANVQGAITRTTSSDLFTNVGTAANPMGIRGINSTLDDLEANGRTRGGALVTTNFPVITYTTGAFNAPSGTICEHLSITGARTSTTAGVVNIGSAVNVMFRRCKIENTAASANSIAVAVTSSNSFKIIDCDVSHTGTGATAVAISITTGSGIISGASISGNTSGAGCLTSASSNGSTVTKSTFRNAGFGINGTGSGSIAIESNSFRNITNIYVKSGGARVISNNVAWGVGGSSQWYQSSGTVVENHQLNNFVGNMGVADADEGNWPTRNETTLTADPFTSSSDLTLNNTSGGGVLVRAAGYPAYLDGGAWQHQDAASGGMIGGGNLDGGFQ